MAEKFSVKHGGEEIWAGLAMTETEAKACARMANKGIPEEEMVAGIIPFIDARLSYMSVETSPTKTRKPRSDKGQTRESKVVNSSKVQKPKNGRRYLVAENVKICNSRSELEAYLIEISGEISGTEGIRIFNYTHELKAKSQFKLETVK